MDRRTFLATTAVTAGAAGSAALGAAPGHAAARFPRDPETVLTGWFRDTYRSLEAMVADNGLPADNIDLSGGAPVLTENTSVTNIGCWIWSTVAAAGLGVISEREMHTRLARTVSTVERMERLHGFWFNWYQTFTGEVLDEWPGSGAPVNHLLSTVDNGWLDVALRIAEDADPLLRGRIRRLRADLDWSFLYVPYDPADPVARPGHMSTGFRVADDALTGNFYGAMISETRIAGFLGMADGTVPGEHYWRMLRTFAPGQTQGMPPGGDWTVRDGVRYFNGHYTYRGRTHVPGWGGSMFGALMPELFVPSTRWNASWRTNLTRHALAQRDHGLLDAEYGYWGFSPANVPEGGYQEYGVQYLGISPEGYCSNTDRTYVPYGAPRPDPSAYTNGVVTPHAAFLALLVTPRAALANLRDLARDFDAYEDGYGFYDSVNVGTGTVSDRMLSLDQGMTAAALAQVLSPGLLQRPFRTGGFRRRLKPLLAREDFGI
ncbi:glucoamylase family protein [Streptomyces synnematoformans]|uniref:Glycoamylase-like domain-containing protein n=1 Tax=Streptomyces synnematoformans TaxID=415721 RepID=A0ABN2ZFX7_9ACTN